MIDKYIHQFMYVMWCFTWITPMELRFQFTVHHSRMGLKLYNIYRINFSLLKIIFIIGRFSTSGLSNYIICTACTHILIVKPSIRGQPHQWWLVSICSTSLGNSRNNNSGVCIAAWFLSHGFTLFCLLFGHWTSIDVPLDTFGPDNEYDSNNE